MRAFLAFDLDNAIIDGAVALSNRLRERVSASRPRWCKTETMHVTARFFGDGVELPIVSGLAERLIAGKSAPRIRITRLDAFPETKRARVLVLPIDDDGALAAIAKEAEEAAIALGFERERRTYRPHLTLARFREPGDVRELVAETKVALEGVVEALTLYESKLGPQGPSYAALERATFAR